MNLLPFVLAGHFIGDWIVQTDWQAANKGGNPRAVVTRAQYRLSWRANLTHVATYTLTLAVCVALSGIGLRSAGVLIAVSAVTHSFIDRRWPVRWLLEHTGSKAFAGLPWGVIAADQALHLSILCLLCGVLR